MYKLLIDIREEDDAIQTQFGSDTVTIDDLLDKIVDLSWEVEHLKEELEEVKEEKREEDMDELYKDHKLGLI